jgi:hypothetical protein
MRNDFGTRYSPPRFPYKKVTKLEEKNLKAWKKLWEEENMLLLRLWIKIVEKKHKEKLCQ